MNPAQHTPGPWAAGQSITAAKPGRLSGSYERITIAQRVNRASDAQLIAAAPELLAALCDLLDSCEATYDNRHERQAALDAIAKATQA
jgi:hypothetical protein